MFDTHLSVVGNVLVAPEWRRAAGTGALMANFRIASTSRRFDRDGGRWVDGHNLRIRVTAWRKLAEGVAASLAVGDPVIVYGRLYTRDWKNEEGQARLSYEMEAYAIGHDLARGRARFYRTRTMSEAGVVEDTAALDGGEPSFVLPDAEVPVAYGEGLPEQTADEQEPTFADVVAGLDDPAGPGDDEVTMEVERLAGTGSPARRARRAPKRESAAV